MATETALAKGQSRVLSKPSSPRSNDGRDNANDDLIIRTGEELGERVGSAANATTTGHHHKGHHPRDDEDMSDESTTYTVLDSLGSGTFGQVVAAASSADGQTRALKVIKNHPAYFHQAHVEIGILRTLNTKCGDRPSGSVIVDLMDYFVCHNHLCLVFELLGMNLYELLRKNKFKGLHLGAIRGMMKQLLGALDVLRDAHVVHCDIKPENILLCRDDSFQVKLVDFGSACFQNRTVYQYIQSRFYRSPEVFLGMSYGMPIDMWSLGCVAAELFLGLPIFPGSSEYDLLSRICETIGTPPADMLAKAPNTNKFFTRVDIGFDESSSSLASSSGGGTSRYKLLSLREFEARSGRRAAMGKKYFKYTEFSDIIASIPYQSSKVDPNDHAAVDAEKKARMVERSAFYDLLTGMMEIDPAVRWTPAQALKHPFITGEPFDEPFAPKPIPERTTPEEREELQRVAAKEAAKISSGEPVKKKKKPIPRDVPPMADVVPPTPPAIPVGGLAAAFAASSASGSAPPIQPITPNVVNPVVAEAFNGAMLQAQAAAHAHAAAAIAAMSPGSIPMSPGGGLGGGYPPFVVGSSGGSFNSPSSLLSGSFIGSPHATNSAAMHPLHFGVSPPTHQLSSMGLSTSHAARAAQAAAAVQLPPASPLGPRGVAFARGMDARHAKPGTSFHGVGGGMWSASASASASRDSLKTLQTVHESMISPPVASPSPIDDDHAEGADWDPTFGEMDDLEMEDAPTKKQANSTTTIAMPTRQAIPPVVNSLSSVAAAFSVGSAPNFASASQFSVSPNSAFATNQTKPTRQKSSKDKAPASDEDGKT
jgi:dual specificity protein kinase YAK1